MNIKNLSIMQSENLHIAYEHGSDGVTIRKDMGPFGAAEMKLTFEEVQRLVNVTKMLAMTSERGVVGR